VWECGEEQTDRQDRYRHADTQTAVTNIHFASITPHMKCNNSAKVCGYLLLLGGKKWRVDGWDAFFCCRISTPLSIQSRDEFITRVVTVTTGSLPSCGRLFIQTCDAVFSSCWRNAKLERTLAVNLSEVSQLKAQRPASLYIVWLTHDVARMSLLLLLLLLLLLMLWPARVFRQTIRPTCSNFSRQVALQITRPRTVFLAHFHVFMETGLPVLNCTLCPPLPVFAAMYLEF